MLPGTSGWTRMRATSSTTLWSESEMVSQSMSLPAEEPGPDPDVREPVRAERRRVEGLLEKLAHQLAGEELHPAVGVVDHEPLVRSEQLVRDDERPYGVVARAAAGVPDDVGITLAQAGVLRRVQPRVHAGKDREPSRRRQCQTALVAEPACVLLVCAEHLVANRHVDPFPGGWLSRIPGRSYKKESGYPT